MKQCPVCGAEHEDDLNVCPKDGAMLMKVAPGQGTHIGMVLKGTYRIEEKIGAGGMGAVYRALQIPLQRNVAIKVLLPHHQTSPELIQRFYRESRLLSGLSHPNIVGIIDFGNTESGMIYMVMEYLQGMTLSEMVPRGEGLPLDTVIGLLDQICSGVGAAHRHNMIHRDLKPSNILLNRATGDLIVVKVLDFGIAKLLETESEGETRLTQTGLAMGTPAYIAPEQISGGVVDSRADIYALGAILYFMIAGRGAYNERSTPGILAKQLSEPPAEIDFEGLGKPEAAPLMEVIYKAMALDPEERYATAEELSEAAQIASGVTGRVVLFHGDAGISAKTPSAASLSASQRIAMETVRGKRFHESPTRATKVLRDGSTTRRRALMAGGGLLALTALGIGGRMAGLFGGGGTAPEAEMTAAFVPRTEGEIVLGMSGDFTGASRALGAEMRAGIRAYFERVNAIGGIHGRRLRLESLDDGYEPARAAKNARDLVENLEVLAFVGNVGTPTTLEILDYAEEKGVLVFGALSGSEKLRNDPPDAVVFNYRASYEQETAAIVGYFLDRLRVPPESIAVLAQDDGYGESGYRGVSKAFHARRLDANAIPRFKYTRNTIDVAEAVAATVAAKPKAVVLVATAEAAAEYVRATRDAGSDAVFASLSYIGSETFAGALAAMGPDYCKDILVTQVVPLPTSGAKSVIEYRADLGQWFPEHAPSFVSLEGYIVATLLVEGLKRIPGEPTSAALADSLEAIDGLDLGFGLLAFSASDHQASDKVWGTRLTPEGKFELIDLE